MPGVGGDPLQAGLPLNTGGMVAGAGAAPLVHPQGTTLGALRLLPVLPPQGKGGT